MVTIEDTTEYDSAKIDVQRVGEKRFIDIQIGDQSFTLYPTADEVLALRDALFDIQ